MRLNILSELDSAPLPFESEERSMFMVWHRRAHLDPAHRWLREQIKAVAAQVVDGSQETGLGDPSGLAAAG
ncbi:MAG: hypothetical protein KJO31_15930 [Gammaproteobacteria bacterium]|nr:hypothetical protein [Gammaproteobacteria bacterium]